MESPTKRPRLDLEPEPEEEPDGMDLQEARAQNDLRLKSIFESIFEKYGKDFTEVGDEIDLNTGDIVVNNGHIYTMKEEDDTGEGDDGWLSDVACSSVSTAKQGQGDMDEDDARQEIMVKGIADYMESRFGRPGPSFADTQLQESPIKNKPQNGVTASTGRPEDEEVTAESEADDDMDAVVFVPMNVQNDLKDLHGSKQMTDPTETVTEKAKLQAGTSTQSAIGLSQPVESIWRVPEIDADFSTPISRKPRPSASFSAVRSASPPGAGSLWALPWTKPRRNTDVARKRSAKKARNTKKHYSSPVVYDWSFAETADGSDSDDPLQDDDKPSPTPRRALTIRGKWAGSGNSSGTTDRCDFCKKTFTRNDYIAHLRAVVGSASPDDHHDPVQAVQQLYAISNATPVTNLAPSNTFRATDTQSLQNGVTEEPTPTKRARHAMTPDEARLIMIMRHVEGKPWKEILSHFPHKKLDQLIKWNQIHWTERLREPPAFSGPWSEAEQESLDQLQDQRGLLWSDVRAALPGRLFAEIEFELLQRWIGDGEWSNQQETRIAADSDPGQGRQATGSDSSPLLQAIHPEVGHKSP
ncbi:hypothetical protein BDV59DRAFT_92895 [Aspergillus ambiguus]|uniref:Myb-like DNA-binding domain protein n=1 Tax=Aspergillus ambiguus TaxID=176160 RepID=UPI003CCD1173